MTKKNLKIKPVEYSVYGVPPLCEYLTNFVLAAGLQNCPYSHNVGSCPSAEIRKNFKSNMSKNAIKLYNQQVTGDFE